MMYLFIIIYSLFLILLVTIQTFFPKLPVKGKTDVTNRYHIYNIMNNQLEDYLNNNLENAVEQGIVSVFESEKLDHKITEIFLKVAMQGISTSREDNMGED